MHDSKDRTVNLPLKPLFWSPSWIYKQAFDSLLIQTQDFFKRRFELPGIWDIILAPCKDIENSGDQVLGSDAPISFQRPAFFETLDMKRILPILKP